MSEGILNGDVAIHSEEDGTVIVHMNRDDLFDLYFGLARKGFDYADPFILREIKFLIRKFFVEEQDVITDPAVSLRFQGEEDPDYYDDILKYRS